MPPLTKKQTVTALIEQNATDQIAVGKQIADLRDALAKIGHRGSPGDPNRGIPATPATGRVGAALRAIIKAHRDSATGDADVGDLERTVADLEGERQKLELRLVAAGQRQNSLVSAKPVILRDHHDELIALARQAVDDGDALWAELASAARAVEQHRTRVQQAIEFALGGHPGTPTGAPQGAVQAAKALRRTFAPYVGATPAINGLWQSVARCTAPAAMPPAEVDDGGPKTVSELEAQRRVQLEAPDWGEA